MALAHFSILMIHSCKNSEWVISKMFWEYSDVERSLGFKVNEEKSVFIPTQRIVFLGYIIDSVEFKVFLPKEKK